MPSRFRLTKAECLAIEYAGKTKDHYDTECKYLAIRIAKKTRTWYYIRKIDGRARFIKLGRFPDMPIPAARKAHDQISGQIAAGESAAVQERPKAQRLADIYETYMAEHMRPKRKSADEDERRWRLYLSRWATKRADRITVSMVAKLHTEIGTDNGHPVMVLSYAGCT